jgi:SpoIID/LytB domain protein
MIAGLSLPKALTARRWIFNRLIKLGPSLRSSILLCPTHNAIHICLCVALLCFRLFPSGSNASPPAPRAALASEDEVDRALQRVAKSALGEREGTVVVMDPQTGRVRAAVNSRLAFTEAFPPGSAIKPFTMLTALRAGLIDDDTRILCHEKYRHGDYTTHCSHPRLHAPFNPAQALAYSCNYYFSKLGEQLNGREFIDTLVSFGFGANASVDEGEATGMLPRGYWRINTALGDDTQLLVTPVQLITAYAALFNGGHLFAPQNARANNFTSRERASLNIAPAHRTLLLKGMRGAVIYGTAAPAGLGSLPQYLFGKTGTATSNDDFHTHGWFIALASELDATDQPPPGSIHLAVLVFLKRAHGAECASVARPVLEEYARWQSGPARAEAFEQEAEGETHFDAQHVELASSSLPVRVRLLHENRTRTLSPDDYVFGVLAAEGSIENEIEALKAQAVISRTFAPKNKGRHEHDGYDFCNSTHCQRYISVRDESVRSNFYELLHRAVRETSGEVLLDQQGELADVYFSASCGGMTANISTLWGTSFAPTYLRGARDEYCENGPHHNWTDIISAAQLTRALRSDRRTDVGARLNNLRIVERDATGRAQIIALEGKRVRLVRGWDFKIIVGRTLGWNLLKSTRFEVAREGASFVFHGSGFGHGLGLCQSGAHVMASRGAFYRQILDQYFPGTRMSRSAASHL